MMSPDQRTKMAERKSSDCLAKLESKPLNVTRKRRICAGSKSWWNTLIHDSKRCTPSKRSWCLGPKSTTRLKTYCNSSGRREELTRRANPSKAQLWPLMWCRVVMIRSQATSRETTARSDSRQILNPRSNILNHSTKTLALISPSTRTMFPRQMVSDLRSTSISLWWMSL